MSILEWWALARAKPRRHEQPEPVDDERWVIDVTAVGSPAIPGRTDDWVVGDADVALIDWQRKPAPDDINEWV